jgi:hypothetical protein
MRTRGRRRWTPAGGRRTSRRVFPANRMDTIAASSCYPTLVNSEDKETTATAYMEDAATSARPPAAHPPAPSPAPPATRPPAPHAAPSATTSAEPPAAHPPAPSPAPPAKIFVPIHQASPLFIKPARNYTQSPLGFP